MQQNLLCRGCLSVEGKFAYIHEFSTAQAYENLIGIPLMPPDRFPQHLCLFCFRTLHKFAEFKARCLKALEVLHQAQAQGQLVTKEYSHSLTSSCPELKPQYIRSKIFTFDIFSSSNSENILKQEATSDLVDHRDIPLEIDKEERLSENEIEDTDVPEEVIFESKYDNNYVDSEIKPCEVFVDDFNNVLNKKKRNIKKKVKKEVTKRTRKKVKEKDKAKRSFVAKKRRKSSKSFKQTVIDYAKSAGFNIAFLTHTEQIQEIEEKKNEVVTNGHNCPQCGKHFDAVNALERHKKNYHILKPNSFICDLCSCIFKNKRTLKTHMTSHSCIFTCQSCNFRTKQRPILRKHQQFHEGKTFPCNYCGKVFAKVTSCFSHVRLNHASKLPWCDLCGEFFISEKGVDNHKMLTHNMTEEFPNACKKCDKRFKNGAALERHVIVKGCDLPNCAQCGDSFASDELLKYHLVQRHFDNAVPATFDCSHCTVRFHNEAALVRHLCGAAVVCNQCGDNFQSPQLLTDHVALKHDIFKCEECGKQFTSSVYFKRHYSLVHNGKARRPLGRPPVKFEGRVKYHQAQHRKYPKMHSTIRKWRVVGERGLVVERHAADGAVVTRDESDMTAMCDVCGKMFRNSTELNTHLKFHSEETLFTCSHCSKGFKQRVQLQMHERVHTGERPYKCPECPKAFKTYQAYTRHYLIHSGLRKHVCQICEKTFQTSTAAKMHIKTVHMKIPMPPRIRNRNH